MNDLLGTIKRVLFTKGRKQNPAQTPTLTELPSLIPDKPFDTYKPPEPLLKKIGSDDEIDALLPMGAIARFRCWIGWVKIKAKTGMSVHQRIKRYNAIHQGGYGAPDTSIKTKR